MAHLENSWGAGSRATPPESTQYLGNAQLLERPVRAWEMWLYRRSTDAPWWASATLLGIAVVLGIAAIFVLATVLLQLSTGPMPGIVRTLIGFVPVAWALILVAGYINWIRWRLRDVKLWRFAWMNDMPFRDRSVSGSPYGQVARKGTGFPRNMRNIERATIWFDDGADDRGSLARNSVAARKDDDRMNFRKPFAFAQLNLQHDVPHIILKNKRSRILPVSGLGVGDRTRIPLDVNFDQRFTLLCPAGYEQDALRIFTPDLLTLLTNAPGDCEVELIDDKLFMYFRHSTPFWRAETMDALQRTLAILEVRVDRRTGRFRAGQEREFAMASRGVAPGAQGALSLRGRRMNSDSGISAVTYLGLAGVVLVGGIVTVLTRFIIPSL